MIKTVIFDMDGVLIDTEPVHYQVSNQHFKNLNIEVPDELYHTFTGSSNKMIYQKIKNHFNLSQDITNLIGDKNHLFFDAFAKDTRLSLMPGVKDLIIELHQNGIQLIVASSSEMEIIDLVFDRFGLNPYFSYKISGNDFPESKPNPAIFNKAVELSNHQKTECIVIEDSTNGIAAAKAAGIFCIAYNGKSGVGQNQQKADKIITDFSDLSYEKIKVINL
ncbi:HAD-IA family hydrolase [Flavobacterium sp. NST-5]|uniref:HAD-IA family hydrolase n=1 Tax=Flavobacterium ichthyis TaxID=2698827 RepID=A0ABW9Z8F2_9FLAO|nr:HAD family phosphatase [Flavobacterium ichthyis]NBL65133.1 HAD-IA family hydrolase [Flavobacterium ichthyis]